MKSVCLLLMTVIAMGCRRSTNPSMDSVDRATGLANSAPANTDVSVVSGHAEGRILFEDMAEELGVHFTPRTGRESGYYSILESLGSGLAFGDIDGDGRPDLAIAGGGIFAANTMPQGLACGVFRQRADASFQLVTEVAGIPTPDFYSHGINLGDIDNDGFCDIVLTGFRGILLLHNQGDGTFLPMDCGIPSDRGVWSTSSALADLDDDGNLDLYVVNYVDLQPGDYGECFVKGHRDVCPPVEYTGVTDEIFRNRGDGTFEDWSQHLTLTPEGKGLAVISGDIDLDGHTDLYVANDTTPNFLYINEGQGTLNEQGLISGSALGATAEAEGSMGVEFADFNNDGRPDIWVSNYENQSFALYESRGPGFFQHVSALRGITAVGQLFVGFGTAGLDADLDGDLDIFVTNGHVMHHSAGSTRRQAPLLFQNQKGQLFRNVAAQAGDYCRALHEGRGLSVADINGDGREDLAISHCDEPVAVLVNRSETPPHTTATRIRLIGRYSNRDAIGAAVSIQSGRHDQPSWVSLQCGGGSYLSSHDRIHTYVTSDVQYTSGARQQIEVDVRWPGGRRTTHQVKPGTLANLVEPLASQN